MTVSLFSLKFSPIKAFNSHRWLPLISFPSDMWCVCVKWDSYPIKCVKLHQFWGSTSCISVLKRSPHFSISSWRTVVLHFCSWDCVRFSVAAEKTSIKSVKSTRSKGTSKVQNQFLKKNVDVCCVFLSYNIKEISHRMKSLTGEVNNSDCRSEPTYPVTCICTHSDSKESVLLCWK